MVPRYYQIGTSFGDCADIIGLAGVFASTESIATSLEPWLAGICAQTCSEAALQNASAIINNGVSIVHL